MKPKSVKNTRQKGRAFVVKVVKILKTELDSSTYEVSGSGAGLDKGDIRIPSLDLVAEAKDWNTISMGQWVKQSEKEGLGYSKTAVIWSVPKSPDIRVDIPLDFFIDLAKRYKEPKIKVLDRELRWKIERLVNSAKVVIKELTN